MIGVTHRASLPIDALLPEILARLRKFPNLVIEAAPGAGKTTRVPAALLSLGGDVLVLEPRRIAARMSARRVADEMEKPLAKPLATRFGSKKAGPRTRLRFLTEGVLTRRLIADSELRGVGTVVLDEFHERHLETDLALALLRRLQRTKTARSAAHRDVGYPGCRARAEISGRLSAVEIGRASVRSENRLDALLRCSARRTSGAALQSVLTRGMPGDILVFLPGALPYIAPHAFANRSPAGMIYCSRNFTAIFRPLNRIARSNLPPNAN